jgi:hypothetical protein
MDFNCTLIIAARIQPMLSRSCSFNIEEYFIMRVKEKCL